MKKPKITLVSPPNIEFRDAGKAHLVEPLGLAYIAAILEKNGYSVNIIDADTLEYSIPKTIQEILISEPDIVGFSCQTLLFPTALKIAAEIKKNKQLITVFGGIHSTSFPDIVKEPAVDFSIVGEGEYAFLGIVECTQGKKQLKEVHGLCYYKNGKITCNPSERITDLDKLPFPARHLLPMKKYGYAFPVPYDKKRSYASLNFSRGCCYNCIFCNSPRQWTRKVVHRSAENIIAELKELVNKYGVNTFYVRDEIFTLNKKNVIKICQGILREKLELNWFCYARADHVDEGMLRMMKKAGCKLIKMGVETGDPEIMKLIKKGETLETIEKAFKLADEVGLYTHASFMIGHPWDSFKTVKRTISFAKKLNPDTLGLPIMTPFPGTEVWDIAKEEKLLLTEDFSKFNVMGSCVMKTKYLNPKQLIKLQKIGLREFYFRGGYIYKALKRILHDPRCLKFYLEPGWILLKWLRLGENG